MIQAMLRLFVGVPLPENIKAHVLAFPKPQELLSVLRWIDRDSLHITLKFLGSVDDKNVSLIQGVLKDVVSRQEKFSLFFQRAGVFPSRRLPQIFWVGVAGELDCLGNLAQNIEDQLDPMGYPTEKRAFRPHLTLARSNRHPAARAKQADQFCTLFSDYSSPSFFVNEVHLIQSHLSSIGSRYQCIGRFPLRIS